MNAQIPATNLAFFVIECDFLEEMSEITIVKLNFLKKLMKLFREKASKIEAEKATKDMKLYGSLNILPTIEFWKK